MRNEYLIIDADRHLMEPADLWIRHIDAKYRDRAPFLITDFSAVAIVDGIQNNGGTSLNGLSRDQLKAMARNGSVLSSFWNDIHWRSQYYDAMLDNFGPQSYIKDLDREGIDVAVCFGTAQLYFNWRDAIDIDYVDAICRAYNDWLYDFRSYKPDRIYGIASVPLQDPRRAAKEAERAATKLGHVGFFVRPNPLNGKPWHHPDYDYFWSAVEDLDKPICFHEGGSTNMPQARLPYAKDFFSRHVMSHPNEQMLAVLSMAGMGIMEKHPKLRVFFAEATSGWVPFWLARLDWLYEHDLISDKRTKEKPSFYFKRQGTVSCESGEETLKSFEAMVGRDNLMWASDYPHPDQIMKFPDSVGPMVADTNISKEMIRKVLWDTPNRFFALNLRESAYRPREVAHAR